jgi:type IV pilus assembly protein PilV
MKSRTHGFSLIEVLVALLVISIGLLGIAKMQALALANTNGGRLRALASIEAASLAASMQAERNYYGNLVAKLTANVTTSTTGATVSSSDSMQNGSVTCTVASAMQTSTATNTCTGTVSCISTAAPCTSQKMAAYDLQQWGGRLQAIMGSAAAASVVCDPTTPPVTCQITINWAEETVNASSTETGAMLSPTYTLFVNP